MSEWQPSERYPDPSVVVEDESFRKYHLPLAKVERLYTGCRWAEGPVWLGDTRSLVIHPASTTHRQLSDEQKIAAGAGPDVVRLSIGIEDVKDIIADLEQSLSRI